MSEENKYIMEFIKSSISSRKFQHLRGKILSAGNYDSKKIGHMTYEQFLEHNKNYLDSLEQNKTEFHKLKLYCNIIDMIKDKSILHIWNEYSQVDFDEFIALYFDDNYKLILLDFY